MRRYLSSVVCAAVFLCWQSAFGEEPESPNASAAPKYGQAPGYAPVPFEAPAASPSNTAPRVPYALPHPSYPVPAPYPSAPPAPQPALPGGAILIEPSSQIQHLLKAAEHLDAAGLHHLAAHARGEATRLEKELAQKRAELERLQVEVNKLAGEPRDQVLVKVKVVELSLTKARALGFDFKKFERNPECPAMPASNDVETNSPTGRESLSMQACDPQGMDGFVNALVAEKLATVLAEPTIVTVDGRRASLFVDGAVPAGLADPAMLNAPQRAGTEVDISPRIVGRNRVRLEVRAQVATPDQTLARSSIPGLRRRGFDTGFEVEFGKTMVVQGLVQLRKPTTGQVNESGKDTSTNEAILTMFMFTPQLVEAITPQPIRR